AAPLKTMPNRPRATMIAAVLTVAAMIGGGSFWFQRERKARLAPSEASMAVLPFTDLSAGRNQDYFTDGLSEELLDNLTRIPGLRVAGRTSSFQFKNKTGDFGD